MLQLQTLEISFANIPGCYKDKSRRNCQYTEFDIYVACFHDVDLYQRLFSRVLTSMQFNSVTFQSILF